MTQDEVVKTQHSRWQRIAKVYQTVAVLLLNTLLFFVVVLIAINYLVPARDDASGGEVKAVGVDAPYSTYFERSAYYLSSPDEVTAMLADYDEMAQDGHWMVHPWTGLTMRTFHSRYLNIDNNGLRMNPPVDSAHANDLPFVVWAFGGSTLFGWGLADKFSVPYLLQAELQKQMPDRRVQVVNFAVPIYNSSQELALFVANLRNSKPDMAFFFDGVNDIWFTVNAKTQTPLVEPLASAWETNTYKITHAQGHDQNWITLEASFPLLRLAQKLGLPIGQPTSPIAEPRYAMRGINELAHDKLISIAVHNYSMNRQMATALGAGLGIKTVFFLQPYLANKVDFVKFRTELAQQPDTSHFYDISLMLTDEVMNSHKSFIDDIHYSDYASGIIAARIADILLQNEG